MADVLLLQCGHGTRAVENTLAVGMAARLRELLCGHGTRAVENASKSVKRFVRSEASMRPRHQGRGEPPRPEPALADEPPASMRPRHQGRGEPGRTWSATARQWASMR